MIGHELDKWPTQCRKNKSVLDALPGFDGTIIRYEPDSAVDNYRKLTSINISHYRTKTIPPGVGMFGGGKVARSGRIACYHGPRRTAGFWKADF